MNIRKRIYSVVLTALFASIFASAFAQVPQTMSYQAVIRRADNELLKNSEVGMRITIIKGATDGEVVYQEVQVLETNSLGLVTAEIGTGVTEDNFSAISWGSDSYFIKTEIDPRGGDFYTITATNRLNSVPYALHANTAGSVDNESDPVFSASPARTITAANIQMWNAISTGDTLIIREEISRIDTVMKIDTIVLATDTLVIREVTSSIDTIVSMNIDTIVLATDTLVIQEFTSSIDTIVNMIYDTIVVENVTSQKDTVVIASDTLYIFDTMTIREEVFVYDSLWIISVDTIVELVPDEAFQNSAAATITFENITQWNSGTGTGIEIESDPVFGASVAASITNDNIDAWNLKLDSYTETDPEFNVSVASDITRTDIENWNNKLDSYSETDPAFNASAASNITTADIANWNSETDPEFSASPASTITQVNITAWNNKITTETDPVFSAWDKDFADITNKPARLDVDASDDVLVTGNQTIAGTKEFTGTVQVQTPVNAADAANKAYVDALESKIADLEYMLLNSGHYLLKDVDGHFYKTVTLGDQIWMAENLNSSKYYNGVEIPLVVDDASWSTASTPARFETEYGMIYNGYAATTPGICPEGWHVSRRSDWEDLNTYLDENGYNYNGIAGANARAIASSEGWTASTSEGAPGYYPLTNNATGFNGYPTGMRYDAGGGLFNTSNEAFWYTEEGEYIKISYYDANIQFRNVTPNYGFFIRCVKN